MILEVPKVNSYKLVQKWYLIKISLKSDMTNDVLELYQIANYKHLKNIKMKYDI